MGSMVDFCLNIKNKYDSYYNQRPQLAMIANNKNDCPYYIKKEEEPIVKKTFWNSFVAWSNR